MYQFQQVGALVRIDPSKAKSMILKALRSARGVVASAAKELSVGERSLFRWIETLDLTAEVQAIKQKHGVPLHGGRPPQSALRRTRKGAAK